MTRDVPGEVVFAADRVVVVNKPCGVTSEDLAAAWQKKLVHRIDRATSGLVVLADDARTVQRLHRDMAAGGVQRTYLCLAHGVVASQTLTSWLVRDRGDGLRGSGAVGVGQQATSVVHTLASGRGNDMGDGVGVDVSLLAVTLITGRTHQIRIQLAEAGHMLVGEPVYRRDHVQRGDVEIVWPRLLLHAWQLRFAHPNTHAAVDVEAPAPPPLSAWLSASLTKRA
jgi:23S rRNA-/tRNA-specific pseudouridylate synthase